jgi:hypothetical protein
VLLQNKKYYQRFPDDVVAVQRIVRHLALQEEGGVRTPSDNLLTPRALQMLGLSGEGAYPLPGRRTRVSVEGPWERIPVCHETQKSLNL